MSDSTWARVDHYISGMLLAPDPTLDAAQAESQAAGLPAISVSPNQGKFLQLLARIQGARTILEIGTLGGFSTIWLARALPPDGKLVTLEAEPRHANVARANLARAGVADRVDVRVGPALATLPTLLSSGLAPFDFIFIDADKPNIPAYLEWAIKLARRGSVIVVDNVVRQGEVANPESTDANVRGVRQFNDMLARETRVTATALQTVGMKGYDGFALLLVTGT
jgi:predicted O-methyltransferase YrrM